LFQRLKLQHDEPLSDFASTFNLRRYIMAMSMCDEVNLYGGDYTLRIFTEVIYCRLGICPFS